MPADGRAETCCLHPLYGCCRTYNFWDKDSKQRLKAMSKAQYGNDPAPITSGSFNADGSIYAYAGGAQVLAPACSAADISWWLYGALNFDVVVHRTAYFAAGMFGIDPCTSHERTASKARPGVNVPPSTCCAIAARV
eukprot:GHUV01039439.1.p1 GENE.GHUV01039439.1~~GHUV01039439.1.p1  ORF type:complete len:137 (+),score=34.31 GHUV01039439.1:301-711(+)